MFCLDFREINKTNGKLPNGNSIILSFLPIILVKYYIFFFTHLSRYRFELKSVSNKLFDLFQKLHFHLVIYRHGKCTI